MVYSRVNGDYKFPGDGVKEGESQLQALHCELREETGTTLETFIRLGGIIHKFVFLELNGYGYIRMFLF
jgi:ADP-ribose pyrophosphatase YjhB (NUDIX family)